jgi:hypothetical protein
MRTEFIDHIDSITDRMELLTALFVATETIHDFRKGQMAAFLQKSTRIQIMEDVLTGAEQVLVKARELDMADGDTLRTYEDNLAIMRAQVDEERENDG